MDGGRTGFRSGRHLCTAYVSCFIHARACAHGTTKRKLKYVILLLSHDILCTARRVYSNERGCCCWYNGRYVCAVYNVIARTNGRSIEDFSQVNPVGFQTRIAFVRYIVSIPFPSLIFYFFQYNPSDIRPVKFSALYNYTLYSFDSNNNNNTT